MVMMVAVITVLFSKVSLGGAKPVPNCMLIAGAALPASCNHRHVDTSMSIRRRGTCARARATEVTAVVVATAAEARAAKVVAAVCVRAVGMSVGVCGKASGGEQVLTWRVVVVTRR